MSAELDWDEIYRLCAPSLRRFIRTRVPEALVEDTLQDTFVRAYRSRARFDAGRPPLPWLLTIARRACFETLRVLPPETPWASVAADASYLPDDPHQVFEGRLRRESMVRALSGLSPRHRRLLLAWDVERDTVYPLLAEQEGISTKALKSALCRARSAFRSRYAALAERAGVAVGVALLPARLRARLQRAWTWLVNGSPLAEATVGGFAAAMVSVAVVMLVPTSGASGVSQAIAASHVADGASSGTSTSESATARRTAGEAPAVATRPAEAGGKPAPQPTPVVDSGAVAARGEAGLGVGPDVSAASITLDVQDSTGTLTYREEVEIRCDGTYLRVVCETARQTPLAH